MTPADEGTKAVKTDDAMLKLLGHLFATTVDPEEVKYVRYTFVNGGKTLYVKDVDCQLGHANAEITIKKAQEMTGLEWDEMSEWLSRCGAKFF